MSDSNERSEAESTPPNIRRNGGPEAKPETQHSNPAGPSKEGRAPVDDPTEALKRDREKCRLPAEVKEQILAELPPLEEHERLYRELMENGGLSAEEFFASLGLEVKPQP